MSSYGDLYFEDLRAGQRWESASRVISESDIMKFADLTGDRDPLHVDKEFAAQTPFRKQIAHGLLGLSYMAGMCSEFPRVKTAAFLRIENWSFLKPIFIGDTIYTTNEIIKLEQHGRRHGLVHWWRKILNERSELVQEGELVTMVAKRVPQRVDSARKIRIDSPGTSPHSGPHATSGNFANQE